MGFPVRFFRGSPTMMVVKYVNGRERARGTGRLFLVGPRTTLAAVPVTDQTVPFAFTELTADGQEVVVQGDLLARYDVDAILARRDFSIESVTGAYESEDPEAVAEDIRHALQAVVRAIVSAKTLHDALASAASIESAARTAITADAAPFTTLGVSVRSVFLTGIAPSNPELQRALEAEARERMLAAADRALADRRMEAAKSDRTLKEYDADTAEKLEQRRAALVKVRNENVVAEAAADAEATQKRLAPYADVDARMVFALGIRELGAGGRVGQVNFTPELLAAFEGARGANGR